MKMLRWICRHMRNDKMKNEDIQDKLGVTKIESKIRENQLKWIEHVS